MRMDQGRNCGFSIETNDTFCNDTSQEVWVREFEEVYRSARHVLSASMVGTGIVGTLGNILILVVYSKLGFQETVHISYVALAVSDLCTVFVTMVYASLNHFVDENVLKGYHLKGDWGRIVDIVGAVPHLAFSRTTALITAWVSLERCVLVLYPIKAKVMITRTISRAVVVSCFLLGCGPMSLFVSAASFDYQSVVFDMASPMSWIATALYGFIYPILTWTTVTICTILLTLKLRQSARFRNLNSSGTPSPGSDQHQMSPREMRLIRTVIAVATVFILFSFPLSAQAVSVMAVYEYSLVGSLQYLFRTITMVCLLLSQINSSVNIVVFTVLGSRFRAALFKMMPCRL